jgi:hypothetical protein
MKANRFPSDDDAANKSRRGRRVSGLVIESLCGFEVMCAAPQLRR